MTPDPLFIRFLQRLEARGRAANTLRAYTLDWRHLLRWHTRTYHDDPAYRPLTLTDLTAFDVRDYLRWCQSQGHKPRTINRRLSLVKQAADWAAEQGALDPTQAQGIRELPQVRQQTLAPRSLAQQEVRRLLKTLETSGDLRDLAIVRTLLFTGLRVGELVALRPADIDLSARKGAITVRASSAKGGKQRLVPIPLQARTTLSRYIAQRRQEHMDDVDRLFMGREGPLSTAGVAAMLRKYAYLARIDHLTPHMLRHTFAYAYMLQTDNDLVGLAAILGHDSLETTQIYTQHSLDALQTNIERLHWP